MLGGHFFRRSGLASALLSTLLPGLARGQGATAQGAEVEVRGAALTPDVAAKDPSVAGSTLRRSSLEAPGLDAPGALRTAVGVSVTETGGLGAPATASIRGATAAETPVYLAGVRINDDVGGAADLSTLPLWLLDRIEVYRGNAPFEADRLGIGGAIFFEPIRPRRTVAALGALAGSWGSRALYGYTAVANADSGLLLGARFQAADNDYRFPSNNGTYAVGDDDRSAQLSNADITLVDVWLLGHTRAAGGRVDLVANRFEREQGAPRAALEPTRLARQSLTRTLAAVSGKTNLGAASLLELRTSILIASAELDDPANELGVGSAGSDGAARLTQRGERVAQEVAGRFELGDMLALRVALEASNERLRRYDGVEVDSPTLAAQRVTARAAAGAQIDVTKAISLRPLAALECHSTDTGSDLGCDALQPVGRVGAFARSDGVSGFLGVGRYVRVPTLGELFGMSLAVRGNPTLENERGVTLDAGMRYARRLEGQLRPLHVAASAYLRQSDDLVTFVRTGQNYVTPVNLGSAVARGIELEAGAGFARYFSADLALTLFDGRDRTRARTLVNDVLPFHSRLIAAPGLAASTGELEHTWLRRASARAELVYQSSRYGDPAGLGVIPEQTTLDFEAGFESARGFAVVRARVADVFDSPRWDVVGFPLPGRTFFVSLELRTGASASAE
jgi:vitamin B12 transporter